MKRIVTLGGGTGTFVTLSGLKMLPDVLVTAVTSSADDGGSTGRLRDSYGFLPVGDARQALVALAEHDTRMRELFAYRFTKGDVAGHNLGNLFLTALTDLLGSEAHAIEEASHLLRVQGTVRIATDTPTVLMAELSDGRELSGETVIDEREHGRAPIQKVFLKNAPHANEEVCNAIREADAIVLGPGDLYTSTIAALLPVGITEAIAKSSAQIIYVTNLFTKTGQTTGYKASDFVREITNYAGRAPNYILVHEGTFPQEALVWYEKESDVPLPDDLPKNDPQVVRLPLASAQALKQPEADTVIRSLIRHDPAKLAAAISFCLANAA